MNRQELCPLDQIPDRDAKGMVARVDGKQRNIVLARRGEAVFAYLNWCPHTQVLIDQIPGQFFDRDNVHLRCAKHGALFRLEDGYCFEGPCEGDSLIALKTEIADGTVYLLED